MCVCVCAAHNNSCIHRMLGLIGCIAYNVPDRYIYKHMYEQFVWKSTKKVHNTAMWLYVCYSIAFYSMQSSLYSLFAFNSRRIRVTSSFSFTYHCGIFCSERKKWKKRAAQTRWSINLHCAKFLIIFIKWMQVHTAQADRESQREREREAEMDSIPFKYHCMMQQQKELQTSSSTIILLLLLVIGWDWAK